MKEKTQDKNSSDDFLYDDIDDETLLEIEQDIANSQEDDDDEQSSKKTTEDYKSIVADDSVKIYLQQIGKIPLLSFEDELEIAR